MFSFFFFNDTATTEIYTLSLHDALPISKRFPYSDLSVTAHRLRKRQVANVRAGDEQNEPHSRKHDQKCLAGRNCNSAKHRDDHRSLFRVVSWIFLLQGECD